MRGRVLVIAALACALAPAARAQGALPGYRGVASVRPGYTHLGERVLYHGMAIVAPDVQVRWSLPATDSGWTWGSARAWRTRGAAGRTGRPVSGLADTVHVEIPLQAFATGLLSVPGIAFTIADPRRGAAGMGRLPLVRLLVVPVIPAGDTSAELRPLRGPLAAPWWERVPWRWVLGGLALLAAVILAIRALVLRRRRAARAAPGAPPLLDPVARALAELAALRRLRLPEQGRFGEHAFHLTRIARAFLEAVTGGTRPGDTTPELIGHLAGSELPPADLDTLAGLLRGWDLLKFARVGSSAGDAERAEAALEDFVRRWAEARRAAESRVA